MNALHEALENLDAALHRANNSAPMLEMRARRTRENRENYFESLSEALNIAFGRAQDQGATFDDGELSRWFDKWNGGVTYGRTVTHSCPCLTFKGKGTTRAMTVVIYRMESGRYELTTYVN